VVVDIVLPAVLSLVLVREAGIEAYDMKVNSTYGLATWWGVSIYQLRKS
jgi:hypothetical protein